ncbi:DEAD/DEAH box helicase [Hymenobacter properus]|uniref:DEAD/DEAH box helicase n=1 Tax=Hymenobacter properus TaxID=2791026 RepID=A0A931FLR9_9BACT|nr:DEAD/DEAH box helicase [Hymenobacter properus]MBF9140969.1 DEAD/DEAH box helicase [Hymenobacter properus]MBR7719778.1 DEAD/DEAH box helicase [Microvirga sp. SRT04]
MQTPDTSAAGAASEAPKSAQLDPQFADFALSPALLAGVAELNFTQPTPVQQLVLAPALEGQDVAGQAPTGSGKTAAYGLAVLQQVDPTSATVQALVLVPARELVLQVRDALQRLGKHLPNLRVAGYYGGHAMRDEVKGLQQMPHVVVATPGRLLDHLERRTIVPNRLKVLVLDEADKLLELGFQEEMATIISRLPQRRQTLLFSATMPDAVLALVRKHLTRPRVMNVGGANATTLPDTLVLRGHVLSASEQKPAALFHLLNQPTAGRALVFANTRDRVEELTRFLRGRGLAAEALHGKMLQPERDKSMLKLRNGSATVLVATDVAARGLDVNDLDTVVQFDPPHDTDTFQHRAGRTARAGATGTAHLLVTPPEQQKIQQWPTAKNVQWAGLRPPALPAAAPKAPRPSTVTLHVSAGKSEKISRGDLAGAFVSVGGLEREAVGRIEVFDHHSFVAVPEAQAQEVLARMQGAKVKGKKVKVALIR